MRRRIFNVFAAAVMLVGMSATAQAQVSIGVTIGQPPPPRVYRVPVRPSAEFVWVEGYWYPQGHHYAWHDGYWTRPPYAGAYWVEPYYARGTYVVGYWGGARGRLEHNHQSDRDHDRRDDRHEESRKDRHERR
jgi:hypothetical protein